mmetsp:Transcript_28098/g.65283  ORF Transcript_28098/g.65283 Transcript_28098/m.65283 type:complete len:200 (-) Transcript_28098:61-660(-)
MSPSTSAHESRSSIRRFGQREACHTSPLQAVCCSDNTSRLASAAREPRLPSTLVKERSMVRSKRSSPSTSMLPVTAVEPSLTCISRTHASSEVIEPYTRPGSNPAGATAESRGATPAEAPGCEIYTLSRIRNLLNTATSPPIRLEPTVSVVSDSSGARADRSPAIPVWVRPSVARRGKCWSSARLPVSPLLKLRSMDLG